MGLLSWAPKAARVLLAVSVLLGWSGSNVGAQTLSLADRGPRFLLASSSRAEPIEIDAGSSVMLRRVVSLDMERPTVGGLLESIERRTGLRFAFDRGLVQVAEPVALRAEAITVAAALTAILGDTEMDVLLSSGRQVALVKRRARPIPVQEGSIVGRVTDKATRIPLRGATVAVEEARYSATTESDGRFRIPEVRAGIYTLRARYIGYAPLSVSVTVVQGSEATADFALEKSVQKLDEVVTTGTVVPTEVKALPTPVTVITRDDIVLQRPRTLATLLRQVVPGAVSWDFASDPAATAFSVRGASTLNPGDGQMKIFVDGIETATLGVAPVDPNSIERIEVVRGPQAAAIYGSDAIGGVIQIFTRRGGSGLTRPRVDAEAALGIIRTPYAGFGNVPRQSYSASVTGGTSDVTYNIGGGYSHTDDYLPNGEQSSQSNPTIYGGMRFERGIMAVDLSGRYNVHNTHVVVNPEFFQSGDVFYSKPNYRPVRWVNQAVGVRLRLTPKGWWHHTLTLGTEQFATERAQSRARLTTPDDTLLTVSENTASKRSVGYNTSVRGSLRSGMSGSLAVGFDHYSYPAASFSTASAVATTGAFDGASAFRLRTQNTGYFAQGQVGFRDALFLTAGLRAEQNTNFSDSLGAPVSPRVGLSYARPMGRTTLKFRGSWGRAIRAPDPANKLAPSDFSLPNLELRPERQRGWDAGVDVVGDAASLGVTYYDQTAEDLVQFVLLTTSPTFVFQFQNVGRVHNTGAEVEGSLSLGPVLLKATYGYSRARIEELGSAYTGDLRVGDQVLATPKHTAGALLSIAPRAGTTVSAGLAYVGAYRQFGNLSITRCFSGAGPCPPSVESGSLRDFIIPYRSITKVNATLWQQVTSQISAFASVDNLFNTYAFEANDALPVMGRISTIGVRAVY